MATFDLDELRGVGGIKDEAALLRFVQQETHPLATLIRQLQGALANVRFTFGTTTLSFSASAYSAVETVPHGLGRVPVLVLAQTGEKAGTWSRVLGITSNYDADSFDLRGEADAAATNSLALAWMAVG